MRRPPLRPLALLALVAALAPVRAHEFWIGLERGRVEPGETIVGDLRVGEMLRGRSYPYRTDRFRSFSVSDGESTVAVDGDDGDVPALRYESADPGLYVISQHSADFRLEYEDWDLFRGYLEEEGLGRFVERHRERNLPETGFTERYTRCIKALVQVGAASASHSDLRVGMPIELVAEGNPYADGTDALAVTLYWRGAPLANWRISVFRSGAAARSTVTTDGEGRARVPLSGAGEYLLSAVHLQAVEDGPVVWHSHWAALGFKLEEAS